MKLFRNGLRFLAMQYFIVDKTMSITFGDCPDALVRSDKVNLFVPSSFCFCEN